jgi:general secretion pathway protein L
VERTTSGSRGLRGGSLGGRQQHVSVFTQALDWWWTGLYDCLPDALRARSQGSERRHILDVRDNGIDLQVLRGPRSQEQHFFGGDAASLRRLEKRLRAAGERGERVVLNGGSVTPLVRSVILPAAAEENLRQVVGFEMDRLTPYRAEDVYYHQVIVERFKDEAKLRLRLFLIPKSSLAASIERLAEIDVMPDVIQVRDGQDWVEVPIAEAAPRGAGKSRFMNMVLAVVCVCLLIAALSMPLARERQVFAQLQDQEGPARAAALEATKVRDRIHLLLASRNLLTESKRSSAGALEVIDRLSDLIPDHTWLFRFELQDGKLSIQGESDAATELIALLAADEMFANVSFSAPVQQNPRSGRERFSLTTEVLQP